ncbi:MAG: hypothetical protein MUE41_15290, partial [Gemmatimonadaceae bacterium]|nr:hypothetical protein [Gemmatimonadaceae bacterium]
LVACARGEADASTTPSLVTQRQRGTLAIDATGQRWVGCGDVATASRSVAPSAELDSALATFPESPTTLFVDVEAAMSPSGALAIAAVHRLDAGIAADAACATPALQVEATGTGTPGWHAWFERDTLRVVHEGAPDTLVRPGTRAPAVDGSVLYRARTAEGDTVSLTISPLVERRGLRGGTAQVSRRAEGCRDSVRQRWTNATATLTDRTGRHDGCAVYTSPLRDPSARRRR